MNDYIYMFTYIYIYSYIKNFFQEMTSIYLFEPYITKIDHKM